MLEVKLENMKKLLRIKIKIWKAEVTDQKGKIGTTINDNLLIACKDCH